MAKQSFTAAGVKAKTAELYALSDASLQTQISEMRSDFKTWLINNFNFDAGQLSYLSAMDSRFLIAAGDHTAIAAGGRLPIIVQIPTPPTGFSSKFIVISGTPVPRFDSVEGYSVTGTLQFTIGYNA